MKIFKYFIFIGSLMVFSFLAVVRVQAGMYTIDQSHSTIGFGVKHLMISTTKGEFADYVGTIKFDKGDLSAFSADVVIQAKSIDTRHDGRDEHLRGADFLDVEAYPTITFQSASLSQSGSGYSIRGKLTMHGVTKEITIPVDISGPIQSPFGGEVLGIAGQVVINRQDFGISWNKTMDQGGLMVGDKVTISIEIEAHKKE